MNHRWLIAHLHDALLRGVSVEIIIPKETDHWVVDRINRHFLSELNKLGAKCYITPMMNHAKAVLIDRKEGLVGSNNLDALSFDWNIEAGIFFNDERMTADLAQIIDEWKTEGKTFESSALSRWYDPFIVIFLGMFRSVL